MRVRVVNRGVGSVSFVTALLLLALLPGAGIVAAATTVALPSAESPVKPGEETPASQTLEDLPSNGVWVPYSVQGADVVQERQQQQLVPPVRQACPAGTTSYPVPNESYSCVSVYADNANTGHLVGMRQGGPNSFGLQKAMSKHGLDEETLAYVVVNNAFGILQQSTGRYLYGLRYEVGGVGIIAVEVYEERQPSAVFNDGHALGVVTAFCPGYQGPCPPGVNESIP